MLVLALGIGIGLVLETFTGWGSKFVAFVKSKIN